MGAVVEVKYFNSFVLKKTVNALVSPDQVVWNGSFGIPQAKGGYPVVNLPSAANAENSWAIEESRIRGGYNNVSTDYGAKAYLVEEEPDAVTRGNSLIYSGIFNSRTGINNTNVFSVADDITKSADPANGTIQKLYAEDTNLIIFQEAKVSRALVDKDAIYTAEGGGAITNSNLTIGTIQPFPGQFGISKNPESFAIYGYNKYFTDKNHNVVMKLGGNLDEISRFGMIDYFRDELVASDTILGAWDIYNDQYVLSLQQTKSGNFNTLSYDEQVQGWTSFYNYKPDQMFSIKNNFYSIASVGAAVPGYALNNYAVYKHYSDTANRSNFYGIDYRSSVTFILNVNPTTSKNFKTIGYEGASGWQLSTLVSDGTGTGLSPASGQWITSNDESALVLSLLEGEYVFNPVGGAPVTRANYQGTLGTTQPPLPRYYAGFNRKENRYVANLINNSNASTGEILFGSEMSGVKGFYVTGVLATDLITNPGGEKQLFSVISDYDINNGY
tara:strand:+ start:112 stop:1611 length:1500 start_codon:yes stop_codon:yes gene_type:complete